MTYISFTKVSLPYGWLGNMAPFRVFHEGRQYLTTEALFQAMRFDDPAIREQIANERSPMGAKMLAKSLSNRMVIQRMSASDLDNMRIVLQLKLEQHPELRRLLVDTGNANIIEDCTRRPHGSGLFWGAAFRGNQWHGENWLGRLWEELRAQ